MSAANSSRGFSKLGVTMPELMAVIAIIGIMSAVAVPRFIASTGLSQLDADANKLILNLKFARMRAKASGFMHFVRMSAGPRVDSLFVYKDLDNNRIFDIAVDSLMRVETLGRSVRFGGGAIGASSSPTAGISSSGMTGFASGHAANSGAECGEGAIATSVNEEGNWNSSKNSTNYRVVNFCPNVIGDIETGGVYLFTTRSDARVHAVGFDDNISLQLLHWVWEGTSWKLQ